MKIGKLGGLCVRGFITLSFFCSVFLSCKTSDSVSAGFLVHTLQDERWAGERDAFTAKFESLGGQVLFENAEQDERNQFHLAKKMIDEGVDVLVVVPVNSKTAASIARLCQQNGVKIIAYDIIIENCDLDMFISFDNEMVGEKMAEYAIQNKPTGNYVMLWGDSDMKISHWIKDGQMKVLNPYIESGQINVVYKSFVENWSGENSEHLIKKVVDCSTSGIDAIVASADGIAEGVIKAYEENGDTVMPLITGQDASAIALDYIRQGKQSMTIRKPFKDLAEEAAVCAHTLAEGKKYETSFVLNNGAKDIPSILLPVTVIDSSNLPD